MWQSLCVFMNNLSKQIRVPCLQVLEIPQHFLTLFEANSSQLEMQTFRDKKMTFSISYKLKH